MKKLVVVILVMSGSALAQIYGPGGSGGGSGPGSQITFLNQAVTSGVLFTLTDNLATLIKETVCQDHTTKAIVGLGITNATINTVTFTPSASQTLDCYVTTGGVGPVGPAGATGVTGTNGSAGATGATGPAGATGATGPVGATGASGSGTGTVNSGTTGQVAAYTGAGTTVGGIGPGTTTQVLHGNAAGQPTYSAVTTGDTDTTIAKTGVDVNTSNQVTVTHLAAALPVAQGGTGTASTLTGIVRGNSSAMTAAELSGDVTTSGSNAVTLAANVVTSPKMAVVNTYRVCSIVIGADNGAALTTADIAPQGRQCFVPAASHIVEIVVAADAGTPAVVLSKNIAGTPTALNASLATAASGGLACANVAGSGTGISGATCSIALSSTTIAAGGWFETTSSASASTAKRMSISIIWTVD